MSQFIIIQGDALEQTRYLQPHGFDGCLCDPPYGYTAFGHRETQAWEKEAVPSDELWGRIFRALKPGALMMAATGTRTYHKIAAAIEAAGFDILDQFNWIYNGANATGVDQGYRLRPAVEPYVVARVPGKGALRGFFNTDVMVDEHRATNVAMSSVFLDPLDGRNTFGFFFCGKATPQERNLVPTDHPTLKPLALTEHLASMLHQPRAKRLLVPFSGVGSEIIGGLRAGWEEVVGLEREVKYCKVAEKRVRAFFPEAEAS